MSELSMTSFAALNANKSSVFQIRNQLAYFARHTGNCDESQRLFPVPFLVALSIVDRPLAVHRDGCKSHFFLRPSSKSGIWINYALLTPHPSSVVKDPETERETLRGWLAAFDRAAKEMNRPQVIFYTYLKDEPNTLEDYRYVQKWGRAVRAAHSVVKVLVVEQPWTEPGQGGAKDVVADVRREHGNGLIASALRIERRSLLPVNARFFGGFQSSAPICFQT